MNKRGRGRPALAPEQKGVHIGPRVLPTTRDALVEIANVTGEACGEILDRLVAKEYHRVTTLHARKKKS